MDTEKIFNGYWMGYQPSGNLLNEIPNYINKVTLFVASPARDGTVNINYLCKDYSKEQQIIWIRQLQSQGTEVMMSLMDTTSTHWHEVDIPAFVKNFKNEIIDGDWGLNGIDINLESGMPDKVWTDTFIKLIYELRTVLGTKGTTNSNSQCNSRISVAAYRPNIELSIFEKAGHKLDWLNTMAHENSVYGNESLFKFYSQYVSHVNIGIGVNYRNGQFVNLDEVAAMANFAKKRNNCGMMEFGLNNDCFHYTGKAQWTRASKINSHMNDILKRTETPLAEFQIAG